MTRPAKLSTLRHLFARAVTNVMGDRGEPAELGKSDLGPVFYDDGTTVHKNRVWARKGANSEVLIRVRADGFNVPDTPGVPIRVEERGGIYWLVSWQEEDYTPAVSGGGSGEPQEVLLNALDFRDFNGVPVFVDYNGLLGPVWRFDSTTGLVSVHAMTPVPHACTQIRISTYYHMRTSFTGVNSLEVVVGSMEAGETATTFIHGYNTTVVTESVAPPADDDTLGVWTVTLNLNNVLSAGDLLAILFKRWGTSGATTNTGVLNFAGMRIEFVDASVGGGTDTSGVHEFPAGAMLADGTSPVVDAPGWAFWEGENSGPLSLLFVAEKSSVTLKLKLHWVGYAFSSGDVVFNIGFSTAAVGAARGSDFDDTTVTLTAGPSHEHMASEITLNFSTLTAGKVSIGDIVNIDIYRNALDAADTSSSYVGVYFATVTENGDGV